MPAFRSPMKSLTALLTRARNDKHLIKAYSSSFHYYDLDITNAKGIERRPKPHPDSLLFGHQFSDHMLEIEWSQEKGWNRPKICPLHNFIMHPASKVYHYAIELYEGMKAYRGPDNQVRLFRPEENMARMRRTAERTLLPDFDSGELLRCINKLISIDQEWVPYSSTSSLYIRPTFIGTEASLGISKSTEALLYVITGPVGPYFRSGLKPVSLLADPTYVRAWAGGSGAFKMGSNYAATIYVQREALEKHGCQQVLWLYGPDHQITEVGTMNFFMFWINEDGDEELVTPSLDTGIVLPGVTRLSVLELARSWGEFKVTERSLTMSDLITGLQQGRVKEAFGTGTASVVCPVDQVVYEGEQVRIPTMADGAPVTMRCFNELQDIQFGRTPSSWSTLVD